MPKVEPAVETFARIKVVGVGGAGGAAINRMKDAGVTGVDFVAINTDAQALHHSKASIKVNIGKETTRGLGVGADPKLAQTAAMESLAEIDEAVKGADMVFVTFGAGGGTGSGAGPIVAKQARDGGALVVGFATKPFAFEGEKRRRNAEEAIDKLRENVDTLIVIPNDKLLQTIDRRTPLLEAFKVADDVLRQGVQGISDLITVHGLVNLDFADVKTVMSDAGTALMGIGRASGENRAIEAAQQAISSPLLEVSIDGARGILFNVIGGKDMSMHEINTVAEAITAAADEDANIIFGATINPELEGELIVTVVATGFDEGYYAKRSHLNARSLPLDDGISSDSNANMVSSSDDNSLAGDDSATMDSATDGAEHDFHTDQPTNMWSASSDHLDSQMSEEMAQELDKPSFLRRFKSRLGSSKPASDQQPSNEQEPSLPVEPDYTSPESPTEENESPVEENTDTTKKSVEEISPTNDEKTPIEQKNDSEKTGPSKKHKH